MAKFNDHPGITKERGFTLLEVLVATALMGLVLVVLLEVLSAGLRSQEAVRLQNGALQVADNVISSYSFTGGLKPGQFHGNKGRFAYQVTVARRYEVRGPEFEHHVVCFLLEVKVAWQERGKTHSLRMETVRTVFQKKA